MKKQANTLDHANDPEICSDCGFMTPAGLYTACEIAAERAFVCDDCRDEHACAACDEANEPRTPNGNFNNGAHLLILGTDADELAEALIVRAKTLAGIDAAIDDTERCGFHQRALELAILRDDMAHAQHEGAWWIRHAYSLIDED